MKWNYKAWNYKAWNYKILGLSVCLWMCIYHASTYADIYAAVKLKWSYKGNLGPERWGQIDPSFSLCSRGKSQSPINIIGKTISKKYDLSLNYTSAPLNIVNDGVTTLQIDNHQTIMNDGHSIQVNFSQNANESITYHGNSYKLVQFHIHTPSENQWHGQSFPMEIHFVHQGENGKVLVIGVFATGGKNNSEMQKIIRNLPSDKGKEHLIANEHINPAELFPSIMDYYNFMGSLTTPPCLENVEWIVLSTPISVSPAQIVMLRKAVGGANARPVQSLNGRQISFSAQMK